MSTTTINSKKAYYHLSPINGSAESPWQKGAPVKGTVNGQKAIGVYLFDSEAIKDAVSGKYLGSASLILNRNTDYGTDAVDVSITFLKDGFSVAGNQTYDQCMKYAVRYAHTLATVSGNQTAVKIPGFWLSFIGGSNPILGFMVYQEKGEGTTEPAYFTTSAKLQLSVSSSPAFESPVWMRPIGQGDVISSDVFSHRLDLREIQYYINLRRNNDGLARITTMDNYQLSTSRVPFEEWPGIITEFQAAISDGTNTSIYGKEGKTAITWKQTGNIHQVDSSSNIILPNAEIVNQLRDALEAPMSNLSTKETLTVAKYARATFDNYGSDFTVNLNTATEWSAREPRSGMNWEYTTERGTKDKVYHRRFGIWMFIDKLTGKTITKAKVRLTRVEGASGTHDITLYPVIVSSVPSSNKSVNEVLDTNTEVGTGSAAVGETVEIELSSTFVTRLQNAIDSSSGTKYYGVGVNDTQYWTNFGTSAKLIINYS